MYFVVSHTLLYIILYYTIKKGHWDSYAREEEEEIEKPCVAMFDPALRVLGRGSFGRVSFSYNDHV